MPEFSRNVISLFQKRAAPEQGGLLSGSDPTKFNENDPLRLWIIQVGIIICTANLLSLGLRKMRQPKVIAEVLGGIILGPTAMGRIPGFTEHIFPQQSRPYLSLVANIGLCLFLFLVGLEIDSGVIKRNARLSATVALAGMALPFGIGAGLSSAVYKKFIDPGIEFTHFMLFTGVAYSITAFPVLCRILTELKLLDTTVGIVVLSAGVGNDIVGWILLALSVALVNASTGLTALYILLVCVGWTIFLMFPVKFVLRWIARKTGSIESGPTVFFMTVTMLILFGSAFFTDVIGVHAIFGAFIAGLIVPREGGLAIIITEKLEDMVSIIFLPLYFTLSGLSTDLGLLDNGITWGYTIAIIVSAFAGKFGGCTLAAHYAAGFNWRESTTIGSLMSCKGLVELIVLNVGLSAGILSPRVFSMFVLEALVLTFMTTPLVTWLYPPQFRRRIDTTGPTFDNVADDEAVVHKKAQPSLDGAFKTRFTVVLDKLEHLPAMMALTQLIQPAPPSTHDRRASLALGARAPSQSNQTLPHFIAAEALRLIELSDRVSAVMKSSVSESLLHTDPLLSIFRMFGQLNGISVSPTLSVVKFEELAYSVAEHARNYDSDMILIPWLPPVHNAFDGSDHHHQPPSTPLHPPTSGEPQQPIALPPTANTATAPTSNFRSPLGQNPFDYFFRGSNISGGQDVSTSMSVIHSQFVRGVFAQAKTDVALFVDQSTLDLYTGVGVPSVVGAEGGKQHVFLPFFGGPDDRLALEFVVQICSNPRIRGTVVRITKSEEGAGHDGNILSAEPGPAGDEGRNMEEINALTIGSRIAGPDTVYGQHNTETRLQSETADNIIWARYAPLRTPANNAPVSDSTSTHSSSASTTSSRPQIEFRTASTPIPLHTALHEAREIALSSANHNAKLIVITGRSRRLAVENHTKELKQLMEEQREKVGSEVRKTIGDVAAAFVVAGVGSGLVVVQQAVGN
ncbi:K(+)/H(+) antiporter 1 [Psilocybe cubensis]|uniref:K(+)/H(+) antiporter 1 n=2 Tax=Psilocybe cubensis TaxID=181762 RepID=A0ACB8GZ46_PSICU|nr:K(+)/H(+) antiporter 1 [Psilocybe cubensis]KAH9480856.1 K(+)/H(+) antiporter 1 [Psilocybe cubensis]